MSKRAFRSTPGDARPSYPTLRRFLGRRGAALTGLALGLLTSGCGLLGESTAGAPPFPPSIIDARTDAGPQADTEPQADTRPEGGPPSSRKR